MLRTWSDSARAWRTTVESSCFSVRGCPLDPPDRLAVLGSTTNIGARIPVARATDSGGAPTTTRMTTDLHILRFRRSTRSPWTTTGCRCPRGRGLSAECASSWRDVATRTNRSR